MTADLEHPSWCDRSHCTVTDHGTGSHRSKSRLVAAEHGRVEVFAERSANAPHTVIVIEDWSQFTDAPTEPDEPVSVIFARIAPARILHQQLGAVLRQVRKDEA